MKHVIYAMENWESFYNEKQLEELIRAKAALDEPSVCEEVSAATNASHQERTCGRVRQMEYKAAKTRRIKQSTANFEFYKMWTVYKSTLKDGRIVRCKDMVPGASSMKTAKRISNKQVRKMQDIPVRARAYHRKVYNYEFDLMYNY